MYNINRTIFLWIAALSMITIFIVGFWGTSARTGCWFIGLALLGCYYWNNAKVSRGFFNARLVLPHEMPQYYEVVTELASKAGIPTPDLYVAPDMVPHSFAAGRGPHNAAVCVSEGLLESWNWNEIRGSIAHDLGQIRNRDTLAWFLAAAGIVTSLFIHPIAQETLPAMLWGMKDDIGLHHVVTSISVSAVLILAGQIIIDEAIRGRVFKADAFAADLMLDGDPLIGSLRRSQNASFPIRGLFSYGYEPGNLPRSRILAKWLISHPTFDERISRLEDAARD